VEITMTTFVDFCSAQWGAKVGVIKHAKDRFGQDYDPATDYWKRMREGIVDALERGATGSDLTKIAERTSDPKKAVNYRAAGTGAAKWVKRVKPIWIASPPAVAWTSGELTVRVKPELGVSIGGQRHAIKLYLRAGDQLTKRRIDAMLYLLEITHGSDETTVGMLDVRRAKLILPTRLVPGIDALLKAEAL
jgi:hypothetical protein